jgi:hypothetical protein
MERVKKMENKEIMKIIKNKLSIEKCSLFGRKGFVMKESNELLASKNMVDFSQIEIERKTWCRLNKDGSLKVFEDKKFWLAPETFFSSAMAISKNIEEFKKAIKYAKIDKDKGRAEALSKSIKTLEVLYSQMKKLFEHAKQLAEAEAKTLRDLEEKNKKHSGKAKLKSKIKKVN